THISTAIPPPPLAGGSHEDEGDVPPYGPDRSRTHRPGRAPRPGGALRPRRRPQGTLVRRLHEQGHVRPPRHALRRLGLPRRPGPPLQRLVAPGGPRVGPPAPADLPALVRPDLS